MKKIEVPHIIVLINPSEPETLEDIHGEIKFFNNQLVEFAKLEFSKVKKNRRVYVDWTNVDEKYRGQGYGRLLVSIFESLVKSWRFKQTFLSASDEDAERFWKKMGYVKHEKSMVKKIK